MTKNSKIELKNTSNTVSDSKNSSLEYLTDLFARFGLSPDCAKIYQICYLYPQSTVAKISDLTKINRTTLYAQINKLVESEFLSRVEDGWKNYLEAKDLEFILAELEIKTQQTISILKSELDDSRGDETKVSIYSDLSSIKECYYKLLREVETTDFYYINGNIIDWYNLDKTFFRKFITERDILCKKQNLEIKAILDSGVGINKNQKLDYAKFYEGVENFDYKYIDDLTYTSNTVMTSNLILIHIIPDNKVIMTSNPFLIQSYKTNFEILWKSL
jgi:sugar-specific transcriptional regulator TrmB